MALNKLNQKQVIGDITYAFTDLEGQLSAAESRTRVPAKLAYGQYHQWAGGTVKTNVDYTTQLDKLTMAAGQTSATFVSYAIDTGSLGNVKFTTFEIDEITTGGQTVYSTRTADTKEAIETAEFFPMGAANEITSPNGRFIQFRIVMSKYTAAPVVSSVALKVMGAAATQEVYDARGGYKTLSQRLQYMGEMAREEYTATNGQTEFLLPNGWTAAGSGLRVFIYVNGNLQVHGAANGYLFSSDGTKVIFNEGLEGPLQAGGADKVTIIANNLGGYMSERSITREDLVGVINGTNKVFTLGRTPILGSESIFLSGICLDDGAGLEEDYIIDGATVTMNYPPIEGEKLTGSYRYWAY